MPYYDENTETERSNQRALAARKRTPRVLGPADDGFDASGCTCACVSYCVLGCSGDPAIADDISGCGSTTSNEDDNKGFF